MITKLRIAVKHAMDSGITVLIINSNSTLHPHFFAGDLATVFILKHQAEENYIIFFLVEEKSWHYLQNTSLRRKTS